MPSYSTNISNTTFVSSAMPNSNFSFYPTIYTGTDQLYQTCIGYLQINLPTLPVNQVESAMLQLAVIAKSGSDPSTVKVGRVLTQYDFSSVTYNTRPDFEPTTSQITLSTADLYTIIKIDITALVNRWIDGSEPNNGIALYLPDGTSVVQFATDNIVYQPYFPELTITYSSFPTQTSAFCFAYAQLANLILQIITLYPSNVISVFTSGLTPYTVTGVPKKLYVSPDATYEALFILEDNQQEEVIPLNTITAIYTGDGSTYDPSIQYLDAPQFPDGCDKNLITAYYNYFSLSTYVDIYSGALVHASGMIYKNEYGILVLSDEAGNTPIFVPVLPINAVLLTAQTGKKAKIPMITAEAQEKK
jgi:hypothetical protein